ncbi:MAG: sigma-54 dependent transcriptional regulator [Dissulfuribacterales bacterium]
MKILVVDDEQEQLEMLADFLRHQGYDVLTASDGTSALKIVQNNSVSLVLLDHKMPGMTGDEVLERIVAINPLIKAIMITAYGEVGTAVRVMQLGAMDFLEKPVDLSLLLQKIQGVEGELAVEQDVQDVVEQVNELELPIRIAARSRAMQEVISMARRVAESPWPVLIRGETGTGKELIARLIHMLSPRSDGPFIEVNCAAIPENLFESELFGHEKGAFTGAVNLRRGRFELANGGSLFLDEVGELPLFLQPKLLRAIQEGRITRVGAEKDVKVDIRIISATNRNLKEMAEQGDFREDLYYRLNVLEIVIPPLRERREDIPALVDFFLSKYSSRPVQISSEAMDLLVKYSYAGNVRELEHVLQRVVTMSRGGVIRSIDLPAELRNSSLEMHGSLVQRLEAMELQMIRNALERCDWVQTRAAEALGISERVLRYKMAKYGIKR